MSSTFSKILKSFLTKKPAVPNRTAGEFPSVTGNYTSSMTAISAASPRRGPVRVTLV